MGLCEERRWPEPRGGTAAAATAAAVCAAADGAASGGERRAGARASRPRPRESPARRVAPQRSRAPRASPVWSCTAAVRLSGARERGAAARARAAPRATRVRAAAWQPRVPLLRRRRRRLAPPPPLAAAARTSLLSFSFAGFAQYFSILPSIFTRSFSPASDARTASTTVRHTSHSVGSFAPAAGAKYNAAAARKSAARDIASVARWRRTSRGRVDKKHTKRERAAAHEVKLSARLRASTVAASTSLAWSESSALARSLSVVRSRPAAVVANPAASLCSPRSLRLIF